VTACRCAEHTDARRIEIEARCIRAQPAHGRFARFELRGPYMNRRERIVDARHGITARCLPDRRTTGAVAGDPGAAVQRQNDRKRAGAVRDAQIEIEPVVTDTRVLEVLARNSIFNVLSPLFVDRRPLHAGHWEHIADQGGRNLGIAVRSFPVPGKIALWLENAGASGLGTAEGDTLGLEISDGKQSFFYIPGCAAMTAELAQRLKGACLVLFDGTLWRDDEMIAAGVGTKTGQRMGHMSCSGPDGTIAAFQDLHIARKIFIHINNTNPLLVEETSERREAEAAGWEIAHDGMEIVLEHALVPAGV